MNFVNVGNKKAKQKNKCLADPIALARYQNTDEQIEGGVIFLFKMSL